MGYRFTRGRPEFVERTPPFGAGADPSNIVDAPIPMVLLSPRWTRAHSLRMQFQPVVTFR